MQAIQTRYIGPTNTKPARIIAKACAGRIIVAYDHELDCTANHGRAARMLADKFDWTWTDYVGGDLPDHSMAWVSDSFASYRTGRKTWAPPE